MLRRLIEVDWRVALQVEDAVQSYLVEHPNHYYMPPGRQWLWYLDRNHGLLQLVNDFTKSSEEEIGEYINEVLEVLNNERR